MKRFLFLLLTPIALHAQVTVDWSYIIGEVCIATDDSNNVYTVRYDYNPAGDIYLTKRNAAGVQQWQVSYDQTDNSKWEKATWVACDPSGNIIVSGSLMSGYSSPVNAASIIMKFSPTGSLLWRVVYESAFDGSYTVKCLVDNAGSIYVLGMGTGPNGFVTKVKKFHSSGTPLWSYFDNAGIGQALNFKFTPDSNIVISGKSVTGSIMGYARITRNGANIWNLAGVNSLTMGDLAGDAFGNTYLVHGVYVTGSTSTTVKKLSPTGSLLWSYDFSMIGYRVEVGTDNMPVIVGTQGSLGSTFLKVDTAGSQLWLNNDADSSYVFLSHAQILMDQYNNTYLAASIMTNMGMCKVNSNGTREWVKTFGTGYSAAFTIGDDYNVYVTGGATARLLQSPPPGTCIAPPGLSTDNITSSSARLNWTVLAGIIRYQVYYRKSSTSTWLRKTVPSGGASTFIGMLSCNTEYQWKIKTVCDTTGPDLLSAFSPVMTFHTGSCIALDQGTFNNQPGTSDRLTLFPNPATNLIHVPFAATESLPVKFHVFDIAGKAVMEMERAVSSGFNETELDVSTLDPGMYFLVVRTNKGVYREAFFKE